MNISRNLTKHSDDETTIQEETFPAAEKILSDIENVVKKDHELTSFEIIPIQDGENRSPVYHEEHSLGLASWCVQPLYCYAYGRLMDLRRSEHRREEPSTVWRWLMGALLLNPDVTSFWNIKREFVRSGRLDAFSELRFAAIVLHHKAKCFEAFAYRRWLLQYLLVDGKSSGWEIEHFLQNEIKDAGISADRYANNYHAWSHREYIVTIWSKMALESYGNLLKKEWVNSGKWCNRHVSDHSGLAYRQFLLNRLIYDERNNFTPSELTERHEFLKNVITSMTNSNEVIFSNDNSWELLNILHTATVSRRPEVDYDRVLAALSYWVEDCKNNENDILAYPGHEALWYHRRFLGHALACLEKSYGRHARYEFDDTTIPCRRRQFVSAEIGEEMPNDGRNIERIGLLSLVFRRDNERIVKISRNLKHDAQTSLSQKFIEYIEKFVSDRTNVEGR